MQHDAAIQHKILSEFSVLPDKKRLLQDFFDQHFEDLRNNDPEAQAGLQKLLRNVLPTGALEELAKVLAGTSEYALEIHNLPEAEGLEHVKAINKERLSYSYYIGNALYAMNKAHSVHTSYEPRTPVSSITGTDMHRDQVQKGKYIIFSCPKNVENALTQIIYVRKAIESIPSELHRRIKIEVATKKAPARTLSLHDTLASLNDVVQIRLKVMFPFSAHKNALKNAIEENSVEVNLQPGTLLIVNEDTMFHRAFRGNVKGIERGATSRILIHNAGAPIQR